MAEVIIMPKLGFNMSEGELVKWHKQVGDTVAKGELFFEINTDKTTMPIEATSDGTVLKIMVEEGETVDVFTPVAVVGASGEDPEAALANGVVTASIDGKVDLSEKKEPAPAPASAPAAEAAASYDFEVIVIGSGPGGYETAIKSAQLGKKTACIEEKNFGGVCLNEGCIPTKTLVKTANLYSEIRESADFGITGINVSDVKVDMNKLQARRKRVVKTLTGGVKALLKKNKVTIIEGHGAFADAHTVEVNGKKYTSENIIIATGSDTFMPPFIPLEGKTNVITSREALELDRLPESIAIIGGGVIGIEFAHVFSKLGSKVTVLELMDNILPMVDEEVSAMVKKRMVGNGVEILNQAKVKKVQDDAVLYELGGEEKSVKAEVVLMAVGRVPNTKGLNAEAIGLEFNKKAIGADGALHTNIPNIYAIGDVNGKVMLAHTASHEGFTALANIDGGNEEMNYDQIPSCIYLDPEIACIGLTEKQAKEKGYDVAIGKFPMMANGKALVEGDTDGIAKVIIDKKYGEILGVHLYGKHVTDMICEISAAMKLESTAEEIIHTIHPHPTVSEVIPEAFMAAVTGKSINF